MASIYNLQFVSQEARCRRNVTCFVSGKLLAFTSCLTPSLPLHRCTWHKRHVTQLESRSHLTGCS